jgi:tetratricopeptide (TPR) repeat protein
MSRKKHRTEQRKHFEGSSRKSYTWLWIALPTAAVGIWVLTFDPFQARQAYRPNSQDQVLTNSAAPVKIALPEPDSLASNPPEDASNLEGMGDTEKGAYLQNLGSQLLAEGKYVEAVSNYQAAVKLSPEDEDAHYNLGLAYAKQGNRDGAKHEYLEALRIYPEYPEARNNLGNMLLTEGNVEGAVTNFKAALEVNSDDPLLHNNLGHALARQGKYDEAIASFREALRLKPDYLEARYNLGMAYLQQKQADQASQVFSDILRTNPDFTAARQGLAKAQHLLTSQTNSP